MQQLLHHIEHWSDFGEINIGMDPYRFRLERNRGINHGATLEVGEILTVRQLEKEIASASKTNSTPEIENIPTVGFHVHETSSCSTQRTDANMHSTIGSSSQQLKEEPNQGNIHAHH